MLFHPEKPDVIGILDWELATLGILWLTWVSAAFRGAAHLTNTAVFSASINSGSAFLQKPNM